MTGLALGRLVLMRHADAAAGGDDLQRSLSARGEADAAEQGRQLARWDGDINKALVSPARRTRQTAQLALPAGSELLIYDAIYEASVGDLLQVLEHAGDAEQMLVGHNPGISGLVSYLTRQSVHMAPGAIVLIEFDPPAPYPLQPGCGQVAMTLQVDS